MTVSFEQAGFRYPGRREWAVSDVTWTVGNGELALVAGPSGSGKSTLLRCINGLVPHFSGGELQGRVLVDGLDTREHGPRSLSRTVGFVFQDPDAQHVTPTVEDELAFGMEQHGLPAATMRSRVDHTLDRLSLHHLRGRAIVTLSGGERQRIAIGAAIAAKPRVLVLDEPLSQLDPVSADEVIAAIRSLNDDGMTVVVAEHRLDRLMPIADQVRWVEPVVPARDSVQDLAAAALSKATTGAREGLSYTDRRISGATVRVMNADLGIGRRTILPTVDLEIGPGEVVALVGPNGSGKTTLLRSLLGTLPALRGRVVVDLGGRGVAYLPQRPGAVLFNETVHDEIAFTRRVNPVAPDAAWLVELLELGPLLDRDPRDLSAGERERAALCAVLSASPALALLDEPTRGMDARRKEILAGLLRGLARVGTTVVVATHDAGLVAQIATRVIHLGGGQVVSTAPQPGVDTRTEKLENSVLDSRP